MTATVPRETLSLGARTFLRTLLGAGCGTVEGYYRHRMRLHELACSRCAAAFAEHPGLPPVHRDTCGTEKGWRAHRYRSELPCGPCAQARKGHTVRYCGTEKGWMLHRRTGEKPCPDCRQAFNARRGTRRAGARAGQETRRPTTDQKGSAMSQNTIPVQAAGLRKGDVLFQPIPTGVRPVTVVDVVRTEVYRKGLRLLGVEILGEELVSDEGNLRSRAVRILSGERVLWDVRR